MGFIESMIEQKTRRGSSKERLQESILRLGELKQRHEQEQADRLREAEDRAMQQARLRLTAARAMTTDKAWWIQTEATPEKRTPVFEFIGKQEDALQIPRSLHEDVRHATQAQTLQEFSDMLRDPFGLYSDQMLETYLDENLGPGYKQNLINDWHQDRITEEAAAKKAKQEAIAAATLTGKPKAAPTEPGVVPPELLQTPSEWAQPPGAVWPAPVTPTPPAEVTPSAPAPITPPLKADFKSWLRWKREQLGVAEAQIPPAMDAARASIFFGQESLTPAGRQRNAGRARGLLKKEDMATFDPESPDAPFQLAEAYIDKIAEGARAKKSETISKVMMNIGKYSNLDDPDVVTKQLMMLDTFKDEDPELVRIIVGNTLRMSPAEEEKQNEMIRYHNAMINRQIKAGHEADARLYQKSFTDAVNRGLGPGDPYFDWAERGLLEATQDVGIGLSITETGPSQIPVGRPGTGEPLVISGNAYPPGAKFGKIPSMTVQQQGAAATKAATKKTTKAATKKKWRLSESNSPEMTNKLRALGFLPQVAGLEARKVFNYHVSQGELTSTGRIGYYQEDKAADFDARTKRIRNAVAVVNAKYGGPPVKKVQPKPKFTGTRLSASKVKEIQEAKKAGYSVEAIIRTNPKWGPAAIRAAYGGY